MAYTDLLTTAQAAKEAFGGHVTPTTMQWWRTTGRGPKYVKIGRRVFYRRAELDDFIAANVRSPEMAA